MAGLGIERDVADLIDDDQRDEAQPPELGLEGARRFASPSRPTHSVAVANADALDGQAGSDRDRGREVTFAGAGRAEQHDVLLAVQEVQLAEVLDHLLLDRALEGEVELLKGLQGGEALVRPGLFANALSEHRHRSSYGRRLQRPEDVAEL